MIRLAAVQRTRKTESVERIKGKKRKEETNGTQSPAKLSY